MTRTHRRTTDERLYAAAQETLPAEGAPAAPANIDDPERRKKALFLGSDGHFELCGDIACVRPSHAAAHRPDPA
jgi:hypothetical protein